MAKEANNPFADLTADLEDATKQTETQEAERRQGKKPEDKKKPEEEQRSKQKPAAEALEGDDDDGFDLNWDPFDAAEPAKKTAKKKQLKSSDEEDEEGGESGQVDESYHDAVEFPDFSQFNDEDEEDEEGDSDEFNDDDADSDDDESSEDDEEGEDEGESEDESDDDGSEFSLDAEIKKIEKLKTSSLRKAYLTNKVQLKHATQERDKYKKAAEEAEQAAESARSEFLENISTPEAPSIEDYEPYQKVISRYNDWKTREIRKIRNGEVRERLARDEATLRQEAARIQVLNGREFDEANKKFEDRIRKDYGDHADRVLDMAYAAADFEIEAHDIRKDFEVEAETKAVEYARNQFTERTKKVTDKIVKAFSLTDEEMQRNPLSFNAYMTRLLNDKKNGDKVLKSLTKDINSIQRILSGPTPPDLTQYTTNAEKEQARELFAEEYKSLQRQREVDAPMFMAMGVGAARFVPVLLKKLNEYERLLGKRGKAPKPTAKGTPPKKRKASDDPDELEAELNRGIGNIG